MNNIPSLRSDCPINFSLEIVGDSWSLLIIRDMVYLGKKTYGEFIASDEKIARNILADRLAKLVDNGILTKRVDPGDKRKEIYELTDKGLDLIPALLFLADWGSTYYAESDMPSAWIEQVRNNRDQLTQLIRETVRNGGSIFVGPNSVMHQLNK